MFQYIAKSSMPLLVEDPRTVRSAGHPGPRIVLVGNFELEPLRVPLAHWIDTLRFSFEAELWPCDHIYPCLQQAGRYRRGDVLAVLIEPRRWSAPGAASQENVGNFLDAISRAAISGEAEIVVVVGPATSQTKIASFGEELVARIRDRGLEVTGGSELYQLYPDLSQEGLLARETTHQDAFPYSNLGYASLATLVARRLYARHRPAKKVIAVDCDNTLWAGRIAEDGPAGVRLTESHREFQARLVAQAKQGRLICLCSKNVEHDVLDLLRGHPEMVLRPEQVVAHRINWIPKWENVQALSAELGLGLESFIFFDDDFMECAEMKIHCPSVLTVQTPPEGASARFLGNIWELDGGAPTEMDQKRAEFYRASRPRLDLQARATSLDDFIAELRVVVTIKQAGIASLRRIAQLLDRTTQFTLNARRPSELALARGLQTGAIQILETWVSDRFGDYGLVGTVIFRADDQGLVVEDLALSCRALGRGVEARMASALGQQARTLGAAEVRFQFTETERNLPMRNYLLSLGCQPGSWATLTEMLSAVPAQVGSSE